MQLRAEIRQLPSQQVEAAEKVFDDFEVGREYRGIVGYIDLRGEGGVVVWGRSGPKYFKGDEHTVYSVFSACNELILNAQPDDGPIAVERKVYSEVTEWDQEMEAGDFVLILLTKEGQGGTVGNMREAWGYDWDYYLPKDLRELCRD